MTKERSGKINKKQSAATPLPAVKPKAAGIDIGSKEHWVCGPADAEGERPVRVFGTTTGELHELARWLGEQGVESAAMESTSVYWIPLYEVLEACGIEPVLVNARQMHNVPGRKTDYSDCQWIQILHSCGLLRGSFRPSDAIARLRALHRQQANFVAQRSRCVQWMQKALDQMNVQVHRAVTDLTGKTGMAIVRAIVDGERDANKLAEHRDPRCRHSAEEIARHLAGNWREEHLFNLKSALDAFDHLDKTVAAYEARLMEEVTALQPPDRQQQEAPRHPSANKERALRARGEQQRRTELWRFAGVDLTRIDGISTGAASLILAEVGPNLSAFPSEKHFVSWLRLCPRTSISGGKPLKKRRNGLGSNRVAAVLRMAATAVQRTKTALGAEFRRIARFKGAAVAVFAVARKLAVLAYRMLRYGHDYVDVGALAYEARFEEKRRLGVAEAARALGYTLVKQEEANAAPG
jgi:transposase